MKIAFWSVGKAHDSYVRGGIEEFTGRVSRYFSAEWQIIAPPKNAATLPPAELKKKEGALVLSMLKEDDYLIALDEYGKSLTSEGLAAMLQSRANDRSKNVVFLIGGAYGIDDAIFKRAQFRWSLSALTFPHQLVRLILAEQVYRACTIMRNEKYHHQ